MKIILKYLIILIIASLVIINTNKHTEPLMCTNNKNTQRIGGKHGLSVRDITTTILGGASVGYFIEKNPIKGIIIFILSAPFIHLIFNVKTMLSHNLGLSDIPDGTGFIPNCISN